MDLSWIGVIWLHTQFDEHMHWRFWRRLDGYPVPGIYLTAEVLELFSWRHASPRIALRSCTLLSYVRE